MNGQLISQLLTSIAEVNVALVVFTLIYLIVLRKLSYFQLNRFYLLAAIGLSLAIGVTNFEIDHVTYSVSNPVQITLSDAFPEFTNTSEEVSLLNQEASIFSTIDWQGLTLMVIGLISLFFLSQLLIQWILLNRTLNRASTLKSELGVYVTDRFASAFTFRNKIYVPASILSMPELGHVIKHEQRHVQLNHHIDNLVFAILKALFWFNPIVWFLQKEIRLIHEFQVDEFVTQKLDVPDYPELLIKLSGNNSPTLFVQPFAHSLIKKRIQKLNQPKSTHMKKGLFFVLLPATAVLF